MQKPAEAPRAEPVADVVTALSKALGEALTAQERLGASLIGFLTGERERRREQHRLAGEERQRQKREGKAEAEKESARVVAAIPELPEEFQLCENCIAAIQNRPAKHNEHLTKHLLGNHLARLEAFARRLDAKSENGAPARGN